MPYTIHWWQYISIHSSRIVSSCLRIFCTSFSSNWFSLISFDRQQPHSVWPNKSITDATFSKKREKKEREKKQHEHFVIGDSSICINITKHRSKNSHETNRTRKKLTMCVCDARIWLCFFLLKFDIDSQNALTIINKVQFRRFSFHTRQFFLSSLRVVLNCCCTLCPLKLRHLTDFHMSIHLCVVNLFV